MLRIDRGKKELHPLAGIELKEASLSERGDVQQMIRNSPGAFFSEMGDSLLLVGEEVRPADYVADRIDLLAVDQEGAAVVVELKRGSHKLHLLQALAYASMVAKWDGRRLIEERAKLTTKDVEAAEEEIQDFLLEETSTLNESQRVILVADAFDYEVLTTAEWLTEKYGLDIRCYRLALFAEAGGEYLSCTCVYPPPEIAANAIRRTGTTTTTRNKYANWDEALATIENVALARFFKAELGRGRDNYLRRRQLLYRVRGKRRFWVAARRDVAYVWQNGRFPHDEAEWSQRLGPEANVQPVKDARCLRFYIHSEEGFAAFLEVIEKEADRYEFTEEAEGPGEAEE